MKKVVVVSLILVAAAVLLLAARPSYRRHQESRAVAQAKSFLTRSDLRNAALSARKALDLNPRNLESCLVMAQITETAGLPQALDWRRRIAEIAPSPENKLLLAAVALRVQAPPYPLASETLRSLAIEATNRVFFHVLSAELALKLGDAASAEEHFQRTGHLEPANPLHELNVAALRLGSTNDAVAANARDTLQRLGQDSPLAVLARRWLIGDSLRRKDLGEAERISRLLVEDRRSAFDDQVTHLDVLRQARSPQFMGYLTSVQHRAQTNAALARMLAVWMNATSLEEEAQEWLHGLPIEIKIEAPVRLALADCYAARKDWTGLGEFLAKEKWGELEFMRLAFLSRVTLEEKQEVVAAGQWRLAIREAGERLGALLWLLGAASDWGQVKAQEELLWHIGQTFPREKWAFRELDRVYAGSGNTRALHRLYTTLVAYDPSDVVAKNNFAATAMLLKANLPRAFETARQIYAERPEEPVMVATYAYSLHLQGRTEQGLAALERLQPGALQQQPVRLYYGLLLSAAGQKEKAAGCFETAAKWGLLPEEAALLAEARR